MQIFKEIGPLRAFLNEQKKHGKIIGLVPTMGALHEGHTRLVGASRSETGLTVTSIYVNPAQFNNQSDLEKYPRSLAKDSEILRAAGNDVLFCPDNSEMYDRPSQLSFDFGELGKILEGKFRPGHFSGVGLVVAKLFNIIKPHRAYFGQKDFQQYLVIKRLVEELKFNIQLHCIPIVRQSDGLAMSSRNSRLTEEEMKTAVIFSKSLQSARKALKTKPWRTVRSEVEQLFQHQANVRLEYFELAERDSLTILNAADHTKSLILLAAGYVGEVRLIDNIYVDN